jgi:hypothetical protein
MHATYGSERESEEVWAELVCSWCTGNDADGDQPCCEDCERLAVRAARTRRIVGLVDAIQRACRLQAQYAAERIPGDHRIAAVVAVVADYDRQIHETVQAQQVDDGLEVAS